MANTLMILAIYVPTHDSHLRKTIVAGSAIVGSPAEDDRIMIDYEGNIYNSSNMVSFDNKLLIAAGRHIDHYPTVARSWVKGSELIPVGTYDYDTHQIEVFDIAALGEWYNT